MYNSANVAKIIKELAKERKVSVKNVLDDVGLNYNTMTNMKTSMPKADNLAKIADYFGCSVDYLLGRQTGNHFNIKNTGDNVGVVGQANAPVTIHNANEKQLSKQEYELLKIFDNLDVVNQAKLLVFAAELEKEG